MAIAARPYLTPLNTRDVYAGLAATFRGLKSRAGSFAQQAPMSALYPSVQPGSAPARQAQCRHLQKCRVKSHSTGARERGGIHSLIHRGIAGERGEEV